MIDDFVTMFGALVCSPRTTKYATEQKARRLRIGFEALRSYAAKTNRHYTPIRSTGVERELRLANETLANSENGIQVLNREIIAVLDLPSTSTHEEALRRLTAKVPCIEHVQSFVQAKHHLQEAMSGVAAELAGMWSDERYVRTEFAFDDN